MNVHPHALPAPILAIVSYFLSPDFLNLLPDKYAHAGLGLAVILAALAPQLVKKNEAQAGAGKENP